ncbi:MAG TPA: hypothetical protein VGI67_06325 [Thermoleophilaceae bacterium]|jgi:hypothetical protein
MRRIDFGPVLAAGGGALLLVSLFLHWYEPGLSAWTVFEVLDLVLAALALGALWVTVANLVWQAAVRGSTLPAIGIGALVVVVSQLVNHPPAAQGASLEIGAWLGLAGSGLMAIGGALTVADVSLSVSLSGGRERRRADEPDPEQAAPPPLRRGAASIANEAAAVEPEVHDELYPAAERRGPIGADDPELWAAPAAEDETLPFDHESDERS